MARTRGLWARICAFDNLLLAFRRARRGKADRPAVARFALELEPRLFALQEALLGERWTPAGYRTFTIYDRKPRTISAAPFQDRVVHHAIMNVLEPVIDARLIHDCHACRRGHGVHRAVERCERWLARYAYALQLDVRAYFPSVDHALLMGKLERIVGDAPLLRVLERLITSGRSDAAPLFTRAGDDWVEALARPRGLPIGNLTSQCFGNLYLADFDHFVKERLRVRAYARYVDDLVLFADDKRQLWAWHQEIQAFLARDRLALHPGKTRLAPTRLGIDLLGYRLLPGRRRLRRGSGYRYRRRLRALARAYGRGEIDLADVRQSVAAWLGHGTGADAVALQRAVLHSVCLRRGADPNDGPPGVARRRLEQQAAAPPFGQPQQERAG